MHWIINQVITFYAYVLFHSNTFSCHKFQIYNKGILCCVICCKMKSLYYSVSKNMDKFTIFILDTYIISTSKNHVTLMRKKLLFYKTIHFIKSLNWSCFKSQNITHSCLFAVCLKEIKVDYVYAMSTTEIFPAICSANMI